MADGFSTIAVGLGLTGVLFLLAGRASAKKRRFGRLSLHMLLALLCLVSGILVITIQFSFQGYRALTREDLAATIHTEPIGPAKFRVTVHMPDGRTERYQLAGNEIYIDAHILKWKPWANLLGLHTAYELDRIAGRYHRIEDEQTKSRTIHTLGSDRVVDLFTLRRRYAWLEPMVDAEYGSAAFFPAYERTVLELHVSTTGLLFRRPPTSS